GRRPPPERRRPRTQAALRTDRRAPGRARSGSSCRTARRRTAARARSPHRRRRPSTRRRPRRRAPRRPPRAPARRDRRPARARARRSRAPARQPPATGRRRPSPTSDSRIETAWACPNPKIGRPAHAAVRNRRDHRSMDDRGTLHLIEDDLKQSWVEVWAAGGLREIEAYLAKHLAFLTYLDETA